MENTKDINPKVKQNILTEMEQSGGSGEQRYRQCDDKVNIGIQCIINLPVDTEVRQVTNNLVSQLEEDLRLAKFEIAELKEDRKQLKAHNDIKHKGYESEYDELLKESSKMKEEMNKMLSEKHLLLAKVNSLETFNNEKVVDECVKNASCDGDCEHVACNTAQLQRLNILKNQGGNRNSPSENASTSALNCPQCNYSSRNKNNIETHVRKDHGTHPSCPFCLIGFFHLTALKKHIEEVHKENTAVIREERPVAKRGPCIFFLQPRGCKKRDNCDFSHERGDRYVTVKVPKFCHNGPGCTWKPRCRYVHPEDGEIIPPRNQREEGRRSPARDQREEGRWSQPREEGFGDINIRQLPPGYTMENYPCIAQPQRPTEIRPRIVLEANQ